MAPGDKNKLDTYPDTLLTRGYLGYTAAQIKAPLLTLMVMMQSCRWLIVLMQV